MDTRRNLWTHIEKATSGYMQNTPWQHIMLIVDLINSRACKPVDVLDLIMQRLRETQIMKDLQIRTQLYVLHLLEACVENCGRPFYIAFFKFKYLNELVKLLSAKYYPDTDASVKTKILESIQRWTFSKGNTKLRDVYSMLQSTGHVFPLSSVESQLPVYDADFLMPVSCNADYLAYQETEAQENAKMLKVLIGSTDPRDVEAANNLIREMVESDPAGTEDLKIIRDIKVANHILDLFESLVEGMTSADEAASSDLVQEHLCMVYVIRDRVSLLCSEISPESDLEGVWELAERVGLTLRRYEAGVTGEAKQSETALISLDDEADLIKVEDEDLLHIFSRPQAGPAEHTFDSLNVFSH